MLAPVRDSGPVENAAQKRSVRSSSPQIRDSAGAIISVAHNILLVEDDPETRSSVVSLFEDHHFAVRAIAGRHEISRYFACNPPDLLILDLQLGQDDDLNLLTELRSRFDVPIIATGDRCDEISCVIALELGADDYIARPFGLRELLARVRAVLRRQKCGRTARTNGSQRGGFRFCGWTLERRTRRLLRPDGNPLVLTKAEYVLLVAFLEAPQRTLSREQLLQATRIHEDVFDRSIDVRVWRLRRKLEIDPRAPEIIKTQRAIGYLFTPGVEPF